MGTMWTLLQITAALQVPLAVLFEPLAQRPALYALPPEEARYVYESRRIGARHVAASLDSVSPFSSLRAWGAGEALMMCNASLSILMLRPFSRGVNADLVRAVRRSTSNLSR